MRRLSTWAIALAWLMVAPASAAPIFVTFEGSGADPAAITPVRDAFRAAIGGGSMAGANGSFGGVRREINWDGVPNALADPNALPANFFNVNSPRGVEFATPGTGFLVSANAGEVEPVLFGFPNDFQTFSPQRLFTALNSPITDIRFFVPGTNTVATTTAFGLIFVDAEVAGGSRIDLFDATDTLVYSRNALVAGNQGLSFLGATVTGGSIGRVRITSGVNTIVSNGVLGNPLDDVVVMDDFLYAEPAARAISEPSGLALSVMGLVGACVAIRRHSWRSTTAGATRM
jgi:hypothetical protein